MIKYSPQLINKVKEVFPDWKEAHKLAEQGNEFLGRYLDDSSSGGMDVDWVLVQTSLDVILQKARSMKMKKELYAMWWKEYTSRTQQS